MVKHFYYQRHKTLTLNCILELAEQSKIKELHALPFPELMTFSKNLIDTHQPIFVVEEVEADKTTYHRHGTNQHQMRRIAQNVGQVKGVKRIMVEMLKSMGADVRLVKPLIGINKKKAKGDAKFFNQLTGWQFTSNEDKRDAALLALFAKY